MVTIYNKANRPIGVAGQSVLPLKEIKIQDKHAYCDVYDEDGNPTGERQLLPGLIALKEMGFVDITVEEVKKSEVKKPEVKEPEEAAAEKPKQKKTRKSKTEE